MNGFDYTLSELRNICGENTLRHHFSDEFPGRIQSICFDTRQIHHPEKEAFVAIRANRDGGKYIHEAWKKGIRNFIVSVGMEVPEDAAFFEVEDSIAALQKIAGYHRSRFSQPVIAITGSNGKTIVKEWLSTVLEDQFQIVKSPKSYNSQIGVPLSLIQLNDEADLGIFEVGISKMGEMEKLASIVKPDIVLITHFGDAHAEGFPSPNAKLYEKLKLIQHDTRLLLSGSGNKLVNAATRNLEVGKKTIGEMPEDTLKISQRQRTASGWKWLVENKDQQQAMSLSVAGDAAFENVCLVVLAAWELGLTLPQIAERLALLHPVSMRMEMISDNPEVTVINDAYNADLASIHNAFSLLSEELNQPERAVILSDLEHQGEGQMATQKLILEEMIRQFGLDGIRLIGPVFHRLGKSIEGLKTYPDTDTFLQEFDYNFYRNKVVLVKGARKFELEKIIPYLSRRAVASWFSINLNHLSYNFRQFKALIGPEVKIMAMVKAFAYGSGTWEIAHALQREGVAYLAVAYTSEGIDLRTRGISVPIMVMNADEDSLGQIFEFGLEPEVYSLAYLKTILKVAERTGRKKVKIHIKVDTGMRRLGFSSDDAPMLGKFLKDHPNIEVVSVLSHLAASDEPDLDAYTQEQIALFHHFSDELINWTTNIPIRHILNTAGIIRFPEQAMEMVRLGIGLYGVLPCESDLELLEIGSLNAVISQIHEYPEGVPVGYGCSQHTTRPSRIATVPIGYADGIRRVLGNGVAHFLVRGKRVPTFGRICMDMLMLDVTEIPGAKEGDGVVLIGHQGDETITVSEIAKLCDTIPYEILTGIGRRLRRIYVKE